MCMCVQVLLEVRGIRYIWAGVRGNCELLVVGAGNSSKALCKSSVPFYLLSHHQLLRFYLRSRRSDAKIVVCFLGTS